MPRTTSEERRTIERFRDRYDRRESTPAERAVARAGTGGLLSVNGYTTLTQAEELRRRLRLRKGARLLDLGCGRGFPGVYLAAESGCSLVGTDLPLPSLRAGMRWAARERLLRRAAFAAASAVHLPFRPQSFDAIVHTDVLC